MGGFRLCALAALPLGAAQVFHHQTEQEEVFWLSLFLLIVAVLVLTLPMMSWGERTWWSPSRYYYVAQPNVVQGEMILPTPGSPRPSSPQQKPNLPSYEDLQQVTVAPAATSSVPSSFFKAPSKLSGAAKDRSRLSQVPTVFSAHGPGFKL